MSENEQVEQPTPALEVPTPPAGTPSQAGLGINDLLLMLQTIQVVAKRGAFRADEMTNIGGLHDRLLNFLETSGAITRTPPTGGPEGTEATQPEGE